MQRYEKPDWSLAKLAVGASDMGWAEGSLMDGRPYYLERWQEGEDHLATFYFSPRDLPDQSPETLFRLLIDAEIVALDTEPIPIDAGEVDDSCGQHLLSVNVVLRDSKETYAHLTVPTVDYYR